jgi:single-strand DNA-binding protein
MSNKGYNRAILAGNLGADGELRRSQNGGAILSLRLGCTTSYYDKEKGEQERTAWVSVKVFGRRAEALAPYLTKGTGLLVDGHIETGSYEKDGVKKFTFDIIADDIILQGGGKRSDSAPADAGEPQQRAPQGNGSRPQYNRQAPQQQYQAPRGGGNGAGSARAPADPQEPVESDGGGFGGDDDSLPF